MVKGVEGLMYEEQLHRLAVPSLKKETPGGRPDSRVQNHEWPKEEETRRVRTRRHHERIRSDAVQDKLRKVVLQATYKLRGILLTDDVNCR